MISCMYFDACIHFRLYLRYNRQSIYLRVSTVWFGFGGDGS